MNNDLQIEKLLKNLPAFKVGPVLNSQILKALENRRLEEEARESFRAPHPSFNFNLLTLFTMNAKKCVALMAAVVLMVAGIFSYQNNSYAYHLGKARTALGELQAVLAGQAPVSFVPRAWAEGVAVDEAAVAELSTTVVDETELAIEIIEEQNDVHLLETALEEIHAVQEESLGVFGEAVQAVENPEAVVTVVAAIETVATQQEQVQENLEAVEVAIAQAPEEPVTVEVITTADVEAALQAPAEGSADPAAEPTEEEDEEGDDEEVVFKVEVCHVRGQERLMPQSLTVAGPAVRAHLNHGDTLGPCAAPSAEERVSEEERQAYLTQWKKRSHEKALEAKVQAMIERKERAEEKIEMLEEFAEDVKELAESQGVDVSSETFARHETLLQEARKAYEVGDLKLARVLAEESKGLFKKIEALEKVTEIAEETHKKEWLEKREQAERDHWAEKVKHGLERASERLEDIQAKAKEAGLELPQDQLEQARSALAQGREAFVAGQFEAVEKLMERFSQAYEWLYGALRRPLDPKSEMKGEAETEVWAEAQVEPVEAEVREKLKIDFDLKADRNAEAAKRERKEWLGEQAERARQESLEKKKREFYEADEQEMKKEEGGSEAEEMKKKELWDKEQERAREAEQRKKEWLQDQQEEDRQAKERRERKELQQNEPKAEPAPAPTEPSAESNVQPQPSTSDLPAEF